jgi:hypothetical protein
MAATTLPGLACFAGGAGVLGLLAFALGAFPWPLRLSLDSQGITLSTLLTRQHWSTDEIERVTLEHDSRRWAWPRRHVLVIERRGHVVARVFGRLDSLAKLAQAAHELGLNH